MVVENLKIDKSNLLPDYYVKYDKLSKTKTVIKFYRNNMSIDMFRKENNILRLIDKVDYKNCILNMEIISQTDDFSKMLTKNKDFKIKGTKNNFSLFSRIDINKFPGVVKGETESLKYNISFMGSYEPIKKKYLNAINKKRIKTTKCNVINTANTFNFSNEIPSSVKWSISHPFQGGRVSPK